MPSPAPGAGQAQPPSQAELQATEALKNDPAVQQSQDPQPTAQGTRSPNETNTDTQTPDLYRLILQVWNEPVDLEGNPIRTGQLAAPSPAAATAEGCGTTGSELAERPAGSPAPCPSAGNAPAP
jgi:hypothetical protein